MQGIENAKNHGRIGSICAIAMVKPNTVESSQLYIFIIFNLLFACSYNYTNNQSYYEHIMNKCFLKSYEGAS